MSGIGWRNAVTHPVAEMAIKAMPTVWITRALLIFPSLVWIEVEVPVGTDRQSWQC